MSDSVTLLNILIVSLSISFGCIAFYLQHIISKGIINKLVANIIAVPFAGIVLAGIYLAHESKGDFYNSTLLVQHILMNIPIIILSLIGILRKK